MWYSGWRNLSGGDMSKMVLVENWKLDQRKCHGSQEVMRAAIASMACVCAAPFCQVQVATDALQGLNTIHFTQN
jgi:hypothetical protein